MSLALLLPTTQAPPAPPGALPLPPFEAFLLSLWPLSLLAAFGFLLVMVPVLSKDWRFEAAQFFRDEGCDENRERREWKKERMLAGIGVVVTMNSVALLLLYLSVR